MKKSIPRLRRVRFKAGGELEVFRSLPERQSEGMREFLELEAKRVVDVVPNMAGFAVIAWNFRGEFSVGYGINYRSPVQRTLMASFVHDVLLKTVTQNEMVDPQDDGA